MDIPEPKVKVIAPEKELEVPGFQATPIQPSTVTGSEIAAPAAAPNEDVEIPKVSIGETVGPVMDQFAKLIEDFRASRDVNLNEPIQPYLPIQQVEEQKQEAKEDIDDEGETVSHPFKLSKVGSKIQIEFGMVYGAYSDGATAYPPAIMRNAEPPYYIPSSIGYVCINLKLNSKYLIIPESLEFSTESTPPQKTHPNYSFVIGYNSNLQSNNSITQSVQFSICGFRGTFSTI